MKFWKEKLICGVFLINKYKSISSVCFFFYSTRMYIFRKKCISENRRGFWHEGIYLLLVGKHNSFFLKYLARIFIFLKKIHITYCIQIFRKKKTLYLCIFLHQKRAKKGSNIYNFESSMNFWLPQKNKLL